MANPVAALGIVARLIAGYLLYRRRDSWLRAVMGAVLGPRERDRDGDHVRPVRIRGCRLLRGGQLGGLDTEVKTGG